MTNPLYLVVWNPVVDLRPINELLEAIGLTLVLYLTALKLEPLTEAMAELYLP